MPTYKKRGATWSAWFDLPKGPDGKRRQRTINGYRTKRLAENEVTRILAEAAKGEYAEPTRETVGEYLMRWLGARDLAPTTRATYLYLIQTHLAPALGHLPLQQLRSLQIDEFYLRMKTSGRKDGKGGLSGQTVAHLHRLLHAALAQAVKWQLLTRNPADAATPPPARRKERPTLTAEQTIHLLEKAGETSLYLPILLAVTAGLRRGECLGLRWCDVDFAAGHFSVRETVVRAGNVAVAGPPKTESSKRDYVPAAFVLDALREAKGQAIADAIEGGEVFREEQRVCLTQAGKPYYPTALTQAHRKLLADLGLPPVHFHDLRHTQATLLLEQKVDIKVVSKGLGHAHTSITQNLYQHVTRRLETEAAEAMERALRPRKRSAPESDVSKMLATPGERASEPLPDSSSYARNPSQN